MHSHIQGLRSIRQTSFVNKVNCRLITKSKHFLSQTPSKMTIVEFDVILNNAGWHVPCLSAIYYHKLNIPINPIWYHILNIARDVNDPPIVFSLSILSTPPIKLLAAYRFKDLGIEKSCLFAPTWHWAVVIPKTPRLEIKDTTLLSFHCPNNTLFTGSTLIRDIPISDDLDKIHHFIVPSLLIAMNSTAC